MPDDNSQLPSIPATPRALADELGASGLPPSLQILLDEGLYNRIKQLAGVMAKAEGFTPKHLLGKPEACFTIINLALDWKRNPHFVAENTYQTPGGSIGFRGNLVQSILEGSGRFIGSPDIEYFGDWKKVVGKFELKTSQRGNEYVAPTWTAADALGLGIIIRWQVRGEKKPRVWPGENDPFYLTQCYPLNSPLWATDPKTQIAYLGIRRFANLAAPGILGAASFDYDEVIDASERARDVTPTRRPQPEYYADLPDPTKEAPEPTKEDEAALEADLATGIEIVDVDGFVHEADDPGIAVDLLLAEIAAAAKLGEDRVKGLWESNQTAIEEIETINRSRASPIYTAFRHAIESFDRPPVQPDAGSVPAAVATQPVPPNAGRRPRGRPPRAPRAAPSEASEPRQEPPQPAERRAQQEETTTNTPVVDPPSAPKSPTAETSPANLVVPLVQRGAQQTDWRQTAENMIAAIKSCTKLDQVKALPFGAFRRDNRLTLDTMRTAAHQSWVEVEMELGRRLRQLQMEQG